MVWDNDVKPISATTEVQTDERKNALQNIEDWILNEKQTTQKVVTLISSEDGHGKSGIMFSFPLKEEEKIIILDLDGGDIPIADSFYKEKFEKGNIIIKDPTSIDLTTGDIDYDETFRKIKLVTEWVKLNHIKQNIKLFVVDGISTLLKYAEFKMRAYFRKNIVDGVETRFWKARSKTFLEVLTLVKSIPVNIIFIAHEDFIKKADRDLSAVAQRTNQMAFQKIRCVKEVTDNNIVYTAIIDKQKFNPINEGQTVDFLTIDKVKKSIKWTGDKVWDLIL